MRVGDKVVLDRAFNNASVVTLVKTAKYFSSVTDGKSEWDVVTSRLSTINPHPEESPAAPSQPMEEEDIWTCYVCGYGINYHEAGEGCPPYQTTVKKDEKPKCRCFHRQGDVCDYPVCLTRAKPASSPTEKPEILTISDYEEVLADHRRLVREIDVIMNGEDGAAKQASLCDLVGDIKELITSFTALTSERDAYRKMLETLREQGGGITENGKYYTPTALWINDLLAKYPSPTNTQK
jgi:hypothetical protein